MSNYTKSTNFATKDNLPTGDPLKIVKGTEIDTEFNNIATAISTKTDNASAAITGGSITGITDLAIADGGTGASTATAALNNLLPSQTSNANKYLQTDGTNASWDAVSLSTADITGTLPIANGGTGTTSTTFVNLASNVTGTLPVANGGTGVTSSTGTGNVVLSNSPTLVTPALGTPASGVATNLTGLPLSTGITGLGTGVATALAINTPNTGAIVVNGGALGTPSSGVVTNLTGTANININGQVGSSTPNSGNFTTLSASSTVNISGGTVDGVAYLDASKNLTTGSVLSFSGVHLTSNRNKDTTYSGTDYTTYPNGFILQNSATPATGLFNSIYFKNNANMQNVFGVVQNSSGYGDFVWAGYSGSYTEWMRLSSSGLTLTSNPTLSGGTANGVLYLNGSKVATSGSALVFDSSDRLIVGAGSAVIGSRIETVATGAGGAISIRGRSSDNYGYLSWNANGASTEYARIGATDTSGLVFGLGASNTEGMRLTSTGLGIGTSSPAVKLDVNGSGRFRGFDSGYYNENVLAIGNASYDPKIGLASNGGYRWNTRIADVGASGAGNYVIRYEEGSLDTVTITRDGNLGLGVTPSAWGVGSSIDVGAQTSVHFSSSVGTLFGKNVYFNAGYKYKATGTARAYVQDDGGHSWHTAASGTAGDAISFSQAMTLTSDGNLLVGTTTPNGKLTVYQSTSGDGTITVGNSQDIYTCNVGKQGSSAYGATAIGDAFLYTSTKNISIMADGASSVIKFSAGGNTERARIDASGNLLVGTTSAGGNGWTLYPTGSGGGVLTVWNRPTTANTTTALEFRDGGTATGSITYTNTATAFNTSSDYRLKNTIAPMTGALAKVALLKPCTYKWNADGSDGEGFIAHELAEVCPHAVTGEKDAVDEEGNPKYQGIDTSFLVATLTAAIQELKAEFDAYKASHP